MDWQTLFAGIAAGVAAASLLKNHFDDEARGRWEADQTTRRENFEKRLSERQFQWQQQQEDQRRKEREEDLARAMEDSTPKLKVSVALGYRSWVNSRINIIIIKVQNVGKVPVFIDPPMFKTPHK